MILETERLEMHFLTTQDATFMQTLLNDELWKKFISDKGAQTLEEAKQYIIKGPIVSYEKFGFGLYLVKTKFSGLSVGICGLIKRDYLESVDIGFAFLPQHRGKGYAVESAKAVILHATKNLKCNKIAAITVPNNTASIQVLTKLGLKFAKSIQPPTGTTLDLYERTFENGSNV